MGRRNYDDPNYKQWRSAVYSRDGYCCQWPNCGSKKRLNAHHIRTWARYPHLRFEVTNGITFCKRCHDAIWGKEEENATFCFELLLRSKNNVKLSSRLHSKNVNARSKKQKSKRTDYTAKYVREIIKAQRKRRY